MSVYAGKIDTVILTLVNGDVLRFEDAYFVVTHSGAIVIERCSNSHPYGLSLPVLVVASGQWLSARVETKEKP